MNKKLIFNDNEIDKRRFYPKNPISVDDVDIDTILVLKKVPFGKNGFKYFIGYKNNNYEITTWPTMLPKMGR